MNITLPIEKARNTLQELVSKIFGQGGWFGPARGPTTLAWLTRIWALCWIVIQSRWMYPAASVLPALKVALVGFFFYLLLSGIFDIFFPKALSSDEARTARTCAEIAIYSFFFYLSGNYASEYYFLYLPPLIIAIRYLDIKKALISLTVAVIGFNIVFFQLVDTPWTFPIWQAYIIRQLVLIGMVLFYAVYRYRTIIADVQKERSGLLAAFKAYNKGVYVLDQEQRLLFVNDVLQIKQGQFRIGQSCASYFNCHGDVCGISARHIMLTSSEDELREREIFIDQDNQPYEVDIFKCPLMNDNSETIGMIGIVTDLTSEQVAENRLVEYTRLVERKVDVLATERNKILETMTELGPLLADHGGPKNVMKVVATVAKDSLNAETAAIFLLEDDRLVRKAIAGFPDEWFMDESYPIDVGITWGALVQDGAGHQYGKPVRVNDVANDPRVVQRHLNKYKEESAFHEVKHLLGVPINGWERSFGVLRVVNKIDEKGNLSLAGFTDEDEKFLVSIASIAASSIESQYINLLKKATRHIQESRAVLTVNEKIFEAQDEEQLLQIIVDEARQTIDVAETAVIHLVDRKGGPLVPMASSPRSSSSKGEAPFRLTEQIADKVIRGKAHIFIPDTYKNRAFSTSETDYRSLLVVPLMIRNYVIGAISVASTSLDAFDEKDDQRLLNALAAQAAIGVEKVKFDDTVRKLNSGLGDIKEASQAVFEQLRLVGYDSASVQIKQDNCLKIIACDGFENPNSIEGIVFPASDARYPNWTALQTGKPFWVEDVRLQFPHFLEEAAKFDSGKIRSWLGVPLVNNQGEVIGMFTLDKHEVGFYTEGHANSAMAFANHMAVALTNKKLLERVEEQGNELEGQNAMSAKLSNAQLGLMGISDTTSLYRTCALKGANIFDVEDCSLYVVNDKGVIDLVASTKIPEHLWRKQEVFLNSKGLTSYAIRDGQCLNLSGSEIREHEKWSGAFRDHLPYLPSQTCHSLLIMPLTDKKGETIGALKLVNRLGSRAGTCFSRFEVDLVQTFASSVSMAIEVAKSFRQQVKEEARQQAYSRMNEELHNINNTVHGAIVLAADTALRRLKQKRYRKTKSELERIYGGAQYVAEELDNLRLGLRTPEVGRVGLINSLKKHAELQNLKGDFQYETIDGLVGDIAYGLFRIGRAAIDNIRKHAGVDEFILELHAIEGVVELVISDNGVGFDADSVMSRETSFGLQNILWLAQSIGAKCEIHSQENLGTRISVRVPL